MKNAGTQGRRAALTLVAVALAATDATAQAQATARGGASRPSTDLHAVRTAVAPDIDGRAGDRPWDAAPPAHAFRMFTPREDGDPTLETEARVLYDERTLYVFVRAFDHRPDSVVRRLARRDTSDPTVDQVLLFLDPLLDRRSGYEFVLTAGGVKSDAILYGDGYTDFSWDGVWEGAVGVDSMGWVAEYAIPLRQLRYGRQAAPAFGIMIGRWVGRSGERMTIPLFRRSRAGLPSQFGTLGGLRDLRASGGVEAVPYVLSRARNLPATAGRAPRVATSTAAGADLEWRPWPNVTLDATANPDFGQVEADPAVLSLTGSEVLQTERRPFFLEGAGLLSFPLDLAGAGQLFYSRRIGRRPSLLGLHGTPDAATETGILGAGRATLFLSPELSVTTLSAVTARELGAASHSGGARHVIEPRAHFAVARVQRDFRRGRSGVGVMVTALDRERGDSGTAALLPRAARAAALTWQHQSADGAYQLAGWAARSEVRGSSASVARLQLSPVHAFQRPDDDVRFDAARTQLAGNAVGIWGGKVGGGIGRFFASYRRFGVGFDVNEVGYLARSAHQRATVEGGVALNRPGRLAGLAFRRTSATLVASGEWGANGLPLTRAVALLGMLERPSLVMLRATYTHELPGALCTIPCTRGGPALVDPPRRTLALDMAGNARRSVVPHLALEGWLDDAGNSRALSTQADVTWRARSNVELSLAAVAADARHAWHYYAQFGAAASDTTHFTVARLRQPSRSLTARINHTLTPVLTVQWYGQAFVSRGAYADVRELADPRAPDPARRFRAYGDTAVTARPGGIDFKQFRSNTVVRWEYRPGSTLFVVWSQARDANGSAPAIPPLWPGRELRELFALPPRNTVAVKASYRLAR